MKYTVRVTLMPHENRDAARDMTWEIEADNNDDAFDRAMRYFLLAEPKDVLHSKADHGDTVIAQYKLARTFLSSIIKQGHKSPDDTLGSIALELRAIARRLNLN